MFNSSQIKVTNVKTNEVTIHKNQNDVYRYYADIISFGCLPVYLKSGRIYKDLYLFERLEPRMRIERFDLKTGEVLETYRSYSEAAEDIGVKTSYNLIKLVCTGVFRHYKGFGFRHSN